MAYTSDFPIFAVATDVVALTIRDDKLSVLLIRRAGQTFTGEWALPGGFVQAHEDLEEAAYRELAEEAGIRRDAITLEQLRTYGTPGRDPRPERVISVAWVALGASLPDPRPDTDADRAEWVPVEAAVQRSLAFDHEQILTDGLERARAKLEYTTLATAFCGPTFTLPELRRVYEEVWGIDVDPRNFQRKVLSADGFVTETGDVVRGRGRPAKVYRAGGASGLHPPILRRS